MDASYRVESKRLRIWESCIRELENATVERHSKVYKLGIIAARAGVSMGEAKAICKDVLLTRHPDLPLHRVEDEIDRNLVNGYDQGMLEGDFK